jgi:alkyl hydroperoxide reductase subunit AhpC
MTELVQLERRHDDFARRSTRVLVASLDGLDDSKKTQADFPHLTVLADPKRTLSEAAGLIHPRAAPDGGDADAPTTIIVDRSGTVRWLYRSPSVIARLSPDDVLREVDKMPGVD